MVGALLLACWFDCAFHVVNEKTTYCDMERRSVHVVCSIAAGGLNALRKMALLSIKVGKKLFDKSSSSATLL